jgi:hypothetical protein
MVNTRANARNTFQSEMDALVLENCLIENSSYEPDQFSMRFAIACAASSLPRGPTCIHLSI